ncbi:MarR family transcriptional regulator [Streptomyces sp. NEAU-H22]|uniref:MarR family winged helix-turn-helix transcriptional regulator n=1 Tax=unclassified Streptomyces TaxID=2593676 RepID=UPI0022580CA8|nr:MULTISPECIES: MarR family transcriptional regulator [unclassified Streptomyces]MCX3288304.1 MarR family transcriptional regulator [Streptomyces sp. NEAU-H22]WMD07190.1 MarR family transcriptional regulator [Streptomyces sp. FXY-T5]
MDADEDDLHTAEQLRWGVSRLASRMRAEHQGSPEPLTRLSSSILADLKHRGPLAISELAAIEGVQAQSLTRVVQDLERQGRVARSRSTTDKRRQDITVTEAGRQALREHVKDGNAWLASALARTTTPAERGLLRLAGQLMQQLALVDLELASTAAPRDERPPEEEGRTR